MDDGVLRCTATVISGPNIKGKTRNWRTLPDAKELVRMCDRANAEIAAAMREGRELPHHVNFNHWGINKDRVFVDRSEVAGYVEQLWLSPVPGAKADAAGAIPQRLMARFRIDPKCPRGEFTKEAILTGAAQSTSLEWFFAREQKDRDRVGFIFNGMAVCPANRMSDCHVNPVFPPAMKILAKVTGGAYGTAAGAASASAEVEGARPVELPAGVPPDVEVEMASVVLPISRIDAGSSTRTYPLSSGGEGKSTAIFLSGILLT